MNFLSQNSCAWVFKYQPLLFSEKKNCYYHTFAIPRSNFRTKPWFHSFITFIYFYAEYFYGLFKKMAEHVLFLFFFLPFFGRGNIISRCSVNKTATNHERRLDCFIIFSQLKFSNVMFSLKAKELILKSYYHLYGTSTYQLCF